MRSLLLVVITFSLVAIGQNAPDPSLLAEIRKIPAIDNHTHVMKVTAAGERDDEYDALPCETLEPSDTQWFLRPENPQIVAAWKGLYGYKYDDRSDAHVKELVAAREKVMQQQGDNFATWVLDHLNTRIMFANRIAMGRGLNAPRFVWVPYDDALLFPLNNALAADTPDRKFFFGREEMLLKRYLGDLKLTALPKTLSEYVSQVLQATLRRQKQNGAVAIKFEAAYLRALDFAPANGQDAAAIYARGVASGTAPSRAEYKTVQDYLFRELALEAGRLGLPLHLHVGVGCGGYFVASGANPFVMQTILNDPALRATKFVLIHGGFPFTEQMTALLTRPNVYTDTSAQPLLLSRTRAAQSIRSYLEYVPEKVLFGSDLYSGDTGAYGWDVVGWQGTNNTREALALALAQMMRDGEITHAQALEFAHMVLHKNAEKLYGLK